MTQPADDKELMAAFAEFKELLQRESQPVGASAAPEVRLAPEASPVPARDAVIQPAPRLQAVERGPAQFTPPPIPPALDALKEWAAPPAADPAPLVAEAEMGAGRRKLIYLSVAIVIAGLAGLGWTLTRSGSPDAPLADVAKSTDLDPLPPETEQSAVEEPAAADTAKEASAEAAPAGKAEATLPASPAKPSAPEADAAAAASAEAPAAPASEAAVPLPAVPVAPAARPVMAAAPRPATAYAPAAPPAPAAPAALAPVAATGAALAPVAVAPGGAVSKLTPPKPAAPAPETAALQPESRVAAPEAEAPAATPPKPAAPAKTAKPKPKPAQPAQTAKKPAKPKSGEAAPAVEAAAAPEPAPPPVPPPAPAPQSDGAFGFVKRTFNSVGSAIGSIGRSVVPR